LIECNYYSSTLPYFDRFDYVSTITQEILFINVIERLIGLIVNKYLSTWRTILCEFYRILNHSLAITTHCIDIGLFTLMLWNFEEREKLIHFVEVLSGSRFHAAFIWLSRLRYDISLIWIEQMLYWLIMFNRKLKEIHNILTMNHIWRTRLYEIGMIERDYCLYFGLSGLLSRSVKIIIDNRFNGFEFYEWLDYSIYITSNGDCLDRYILRFNEIIESSRIIYSLLFCCSSLLFGVLCFVLFCCFVVLLFFCYWYSLFS
jgi:NADH:ubiquinone oxidoreductase subunit D